MRLSDSLLVQPLDDGDIVIRDESSDSEVVIPAEIVRDVGIAIEQLAVAYDSQHRLNEYMATEAHDGSSDMQAVMDAVQDGK